MRILGVSGSMQAKSANLSLLEAAQTMAPIGVDFVLFDGIRDLPHFDPDLEAGGPPAAVRDWRRALADSDALLIASPEYGHSLPGSLKNAIDWVIGSGELEQKIVAVTASTPAPDRGTLGLRALSITLGAVSARIVGGQPIVRGPAFDQDLGDLLKALIETVEKSGLVESGQANQPGAEPFAIYRSLDLGPGGYARAPAREAKAAVRALVRRKHHR